MGGTIKDVCKRTGLSQGTVSKYLNNKSISAENRQNIQAAIAELGYQVNSVARGLRTSSTKTIGILVPDLGNVFSTAIVQTVESLLTLRGYSSIICFHNSDIAQEEKKLDLLLSRQVDGVLLMPSSAAQRQGFARLETALGDGLPVVVFNAALPQLCYDSVLVDNPDTTRRAVEQCYRLGHTRIGMLISDSVSFSSLERVQGYEQAHRALGLEYCPERIGVCRSAGKRASCESTFELMLERTELTALIATGYRTVLGAKKALDALERTRERSVLLIGFDCGDVADIVTPPISYFDFPAQEIATRCVQTLLQRLEGDYSDFPSTVRITTKYISF